MGSNGTKGTWRYKRGEALLKDIKVKKKTPNLPKFRTLELKK